MFVVDLRRFQHVLGHVSEVGPTINSPVITIFCDSNYNLFPRKVNAST